MAERHQGYIFKKKIKAKKSNEDQAKWPNWLDVIRLNFIDIAQAKVFINCLTSYYTLYLTVFPNFFVNPSLKVTVLHFLGTSLLSEKRKFSLL